MINGSFVQINVDVVIATNVMKVSISSRELEILRKSADGLTVQQIANDLNVPEQDISKTQKKVLQKIGTGNVLNALQVLAKRGFVLAHD
jgi:DNA-binding NarL/FixJ family response regulator